jgi:hypothetical protein
VDNNNANIQTAPAATDYEALRAKYTDIMTVTGSDLGCYSSHVIIKAFGEDTNNPRFLIGKDANDAVVAARERARESLELQREAEDRLYNAERNVQIFKNRNEVLNGEISNWKDRCKRLQGSVDRMIDSATKFETDLGHLRNHLGQKKFEEILTAAYAEVF